MNVRFSLLSAILISVAGAMAQPSDTTFVYLKGGGVDAYPSDLAQVGQLTDGGLEIVWGDKTIVRYAVEDIEHVSREAPEGLPQLTMFKINNKYNDQVYTDVEAKIGDDEVNLQIGCIGKWLTPSFQLSDERATAYIGSERQQSKVSRHRFAKDIVYTVALPDMQILRRNQLTEEVWSQTTPTVIPMTLTVGQLSTNAPSNYDEGLDKMLDGNPVTFFHSTWGEGKYQKLPENVCPYIDVRLDEPLNHVQWTMTTRGDANRMPQKIELLASADGRQWKSVTVYTVSGGLPVTPGDTFISPVEDLGGDYGWLRLKLLEASYKNYFCVAELSIAKVVVNDGEGPQLLEPATYEYKMEPYGHDYHVRVDWLADQAKGVPAVYIKTSNGQMISSKTTYMDAEISIDGAGVFPSMEATPVHVRGRGNTSWSSDPWSKNPYRLKFDEKVKPFGLTKGKSWVLLANKLKGSMMTNAIGMKAACLAGTAGANHVIPVELYINGQYRGSYNFTEKVGFSNNSIELNNEENAVLLELDSYYDETYKFKSSPYSLPVNIKEPDFSEGQSKLTLADVIADFNKAMGQLKKENIDEAFDLEYLARFLMVSELIENYEIMHPKSTFLYKENLKDGSKYIFGPVWDLDWAFGYELTYNYCRSEQMADYFTRIRMEASQWARDLRYLNKKLDRVYYKVWTQFMMYGLSELLDFCEDYYAFARPSFENNQQLWNDGANYEAFASNARNWLEKRANYVYSHLTSYDLTEEELDPLTGTQEVQIAEREDDEKSRWADVYNLQGQCVKHHVDINHLRSNLSPGIYVINGRKMVVR